VLFSTPERPGFESLIKGTECADRVVGTLSATTMNYQVNATNFNESSTHGIFEAVDFVGRLSVLILNKASTAHREELLRSKIDVLIG
jgi:hypothetical protein